MLEVVLDFETASMAKLDVVGAEVYSRDATTHILSLTYDEGEVYLWTPGEADTRLCDRALDPDVMFICHNAGFEKAIWRNIMVPIYDFPDIPNERWHDIMAVCAYKQVPLGLDKALKALGMKGKNLAGSKFTKSLSKPNKKGEFKRDAASLQRVYDYNVDDVQDEKSLHRRLGYLPAEERRVWLLDQTINERGVRIDLCFVQAAMDIVARTTLPLVQEFNEITGGIKPTEVAQFRGWLAGQGVDLPDLRKETLAKLGLGDDDADEGDAPQSLGLDALPGNVRRALVIRSIVGSSAVKKLPRMGQCCGVDGRARGLLQYHRAGPGRWAGRLFQPQNFPRGVLSKEHSHEEIAASIMAGSGEDFLLLDGTPAHPIQVVASALRMALVPDAGKIFAIGDFSSIEARLVLGLSGQADKTQLIEAGADVYEDFCNVAGRPGERQDVGKPGVLSCGFGSGAAGLCRKKMAGCQCAQSKSFACEHPDSDAFKTAQTCIKTYREDWAPKVEKMWHAFDEAVFNTVAKHKPHETHGIEFDLEDVWLTARLLDGKKIYYLHPEITKRHMPWSTKEKPDVRNCVTYMAEKSGQLRREAMYGSKTVQNIIEGLGRQQLVHAMFACEAAHMPVVLTVTDEIVCEVADEGLDYEGMLCDIMQTRAQWAIDIGVPIAAGCRQVARYGKW